MPQRVLIVEDNPLNRELASVVLEAAGYDVATAGDAVECMALLARQRPDVILMDLRLPGKDGLELTRELRATPALKDVVIVALTAYAMPGDVQRAIAAGCDGYLTKPIQTRQLAQQVAAIIADGKGVKGSQTG